MSDRVRIVRGDARALDFPDGSFDAIVCLEAAGDSVTEYQDIIAETRPAWHRTQAIYEERRSEVVYRYGKRIADRTRAQVQRIPTILTRYATFPVLSVLN